jgi:hypothetical protein
VATIQEPAVAASLIHKRPILRFLGAPWGCGGCNGCAMAEPTCLGGLIRRGRTTTTMADMRARGSSGIRRGQGAALATHGQAVSTWTEGVRVGRTTSSLLEDGRSSITGNTSERGSAAVNFPRGELRQRPPLGMSSMGSQRRVQRATTPLGREQRHVFMLLCIHIYANVNRCLRHIFQLMATLPSIVCL